MRVHVNCLWIGLLVRQKALLNRSQAEKIIDNVLLEASSYGERITVGGQAQQLPHESLLSAHDPILTQTYGEFPLQSLDVLLDEAMNYIDRNDRYNNIRFLDVGSGCGRLCLYLAMCRKDWKVRGIEIFPEMHRRAIQATQKAVVEALFEEWTSHSKEEEETSKSTLLALSLGDIKDQTNLLSASNLIFCYSTTFEGSGLFSERAGGMLLSSEWNELFTKHCQTGTIVITTEKTLDPSCGWEPLQRIDVPNREVFGSTGVIVRRI